jgi:hypothetical protein
VDAAALATLVLLEPRSDAMLLHTAAARALGSDLRAFVTCDARSGQAARDAGLPVVRPA